MKTWTSTIRRVLNYNPDANLDLLHVAYRFIHDLPKSEVVLASSWQPSAVEEIASVLIDLRLDTASIIAGILVGAVNGRLVTLERIKEVFGGDVAFLVEGVTRISMLPNRVKSESQAEDHRKMILAMARDIRVILVRLSLCLYQIRSVAQHSDVVVDPKKGWEILEILAPIAHRLGIYWIKSELEDFAFRLLYPAIYEEIKSLVEKRREGGADDMRKVIALFKKLMRKHGIASQVVGREKHLYSIWTKITRKNITFDELHDLVGYRIIVRKKSDCYWALGMIHGEFMPVPGRFKDYIALPKSNGYQSLHTVVIGPFGNQIEVQIRTEKMHQIAESGVAAHWSYKGGIHTKKSSTATGYAYLKQIVETHQNAEDPVQFLENVKIDLFPDEIYLFTPNGDIITLPKGSTPVDFAYAVHSEVGDRCQGCRVNGRMVPLKTTLQTGDTVEIITGNHSHPNMNWLQFVKSGRAKYRITRWDKEQKRLESIDLGRELLEREVRKAGLGVSLREKLLNQAATEWKVAGEEELLYQIGSSRLSAQQVFHRMFPEYARRAVERGVGRVKSSSGSERKSEEHREGLLKISGVMTDMEVYAARCCSPIPGDLIVGIVTTGKGITVHQSQCRNLIPLLDQPERWIADLQWPDLDKQGHKARLRAVVNNSREIVAQVSQEVIDAKSIVLHAQFQDRDRDPCQLYLDIEVSSLDVLDRIMDKIRSLPAVLSVERIRE
ncbi:MAG: bifunctional (p)ppGpp synthetase/guanosine-3',5'-bis(diphosphate) 3'-pyrophosphohydrolase [Magnetococcus sp. DMHC-6]